MITAAEIARALGGRKSGSGWVCQCVTHDDKNPSLSISQGNDGRVLVHCHAGCDPRDVIDALISRGLWPDPKQHRERPAPASRPKPVKATHASHSAAEQIAKAQRRWRGTVDPRGTWAEDYVASRKLRLPADPEILLRTLRYHPRCPFPDRKIGPALIAAFTPIWTEVPDDPFLDPSPTAIHRIRGRGHENKAMLAPVKGCAVMISPWWHVHGMLHVCEGVETALALYNEGGDFEDRHRPVWALGSKEAIRALPVITRVHRLVIWADHDVGGGSVACAREAADHWVAAGKRVVIRYPGKQGEDYADRAG